MRYYYNKQKILPLDIKEVTKSLKGKLITGGKYLEKFERKISNMVGAKYAVVVNNGTSALQLAIQSLNLKTGSNVIVPNITFSATASSVLINRHNLYLCDVDKYTGHISIESLKNLVSKHKKNFFQLLLTVDLRGAPVDYYGISNFCKKNGMPLFLMVAIHLELIFK